jgi:hypothetical protein
MARRCEVHTKSVGMLDPHTKRASSATEHGPCRLSIVGKPNCGYRSILLVEGAIIIEVVPVPSWIASVEAQVGSDKLQRQMVSRTASNAVNDFPGRVFFLCVLCVPS